MDDLIRKYTTPVDLGVVDGLRRLGLDSFADRVEEERRPSYREAHDRDALRLAQIAELTLQLARADAVIKRLEGALDEARRR